MAYETSLQERLRHDAERAEENLARQRREATLEGDDMASSLPNGMHAWAMFDTPDDVDDAVGEDGDPGLIVSTSEIIRKTGGTWATN